MSLVWRAAMNPPPPSEGYQVPLSIDAANNLLISQTG